MKDFLNSTAIARVNGFLADTAAPNSWKRRSIVTGSQRVSKSGLLICCLQRGRSSEAVLCKNELQRVFPKEEITDSEPVKAVKSAERAREKRGDFSYSEKALPR